MNKVLGMLMFACALFLSIPGCGGSGENTNVIEDTEQSAIEAYDAAIAAEEAAMNDDPPAE